MSAVDGVDVAGGRPLRTMRAMAQDRYGPPTAVLALREMPVPVPGDGQVLVRVRAVGLNPADLFLTTARPAFMRLIMGLRRPRTPVRGQDVAGVVEAVGPGVTSVAPGDEVFGEANVGKGTGTLAELAVVAAQGLAPKPAGLSWEQAGAIPMVGLTALHAMRAADVGAGTRVLVNGASGGVGHLAVQLAAARGAHVTAVCSARNAEMLRGLGADRVIDYATQDFTRGGEQWDVILDNVANHRLRDLRRALTRNGVLLTNNGSRGGRLLGPLPRLARGVLYGLVVRQRVRPFQFEPATADLVELKDLVDGGEVTVVVERSYPLEQAGAALERIATGHVAGKVVVTV